MMNNEILKNEDLNSQEDKFGLDFWEKNKEEIKDVVRPFVEKFKNSDHDKIISRFYKYEDFKPAGNALYSSLSEVLDIDPEMKYETSFEEKPKSFYKHSNNSIVIRTGIGDSRLGKKELACKIFNIIAHEMFHAYQHKVSNSDMERSELYSYEFNNYKSTETHCTNDYASQFVEMEAMFFGFNISEMILDEIGERE